MKYKALTLILTLILFFYGCRETGRHIQTFFTSSHDKVKEYENVVSTDSILITRLVVKTPYTIYPSILKDDTRKKKFMDSISKNSFLVINLCTPFEIKSTFEISNLNIKVIRLNKNEELKLHSLFVSDLKHYYNPYDFIGKQFSDFDSIKIDKGKVSNNILVGAEYSLSGINDTVFIIKTQITLKSNKNVKNINLIDTVFQKIESYNEMPYKVH